MRDNDKSEGWETLKTKLGEIRKVPLDSIYIDLRFQRPLGEHRKEQIKNEYHPQGIGVIAVATILGGDPEGSGKTYASIDGQTRLVALWQLRQEIAAGEREGHEPVPDDIDAEVYEGLTVGEAAELFRLRNFQTAVPVRERERIGLTAGDPIMQELQNQVDKAGFTLFPENGTPATMPHIDTGKRIMRMAKKYGRPDLLAEVLTITANAFGTDVGAADKVLMQATASLLRKNPHLDEARYTDLIRERTAGRISGEAEVLRGQLGMRKATATEFYVAREYNNLKGVEKIPALTAQSQHRLNRRGEPLMIMSESEERDFADKVTALVRYLPTADNPDGGPTATTIQVLRCVALWLEKEGKAELAAYAREPLEGLAAEAKANAERAAEVAAEAKAMAELASAMASEAETSADSAGESANQAEASADAVRELAEA